MDTVNWKDLVNCRVLVTVYPSWDDVSEATVIEVSPSGSRVKLKYGDHPGAAQWKDTSQIKLVEVLGLRIQKGN